MADTKVTISLEVLDKAASKTLDDFGKKADKADKALKDMSFSASGAFKDIGVHIGKTTGLFDIFAGNVLANLAIKGLEATTEAASKLFDVFVVQGVHAAQEAETALNDLNIALAQNGNLTEESSEAFELYAEKMQDLTGIEDDAIIKNAALLENLTGLNEQGLQRATTAALDLSAALGKDLGTATEILGKAASGNVTALQKLGIEVQKGASDAQTFQNVLKTLEDRFGGQAEGKVKTFSGSVALMGANFNNLQEAIGNIIVKNPIVAATLGAVSTVFKELTNNVKGSEGGFKALLGEGIIQTIKGLTLLVSTFDVVAKAVNTLGELIAFPFKNLATLISAAAQAADGEFEQAAITMKDGFITSIKDIAAASKTDTIFVGLGEKLADIQGKAEGAFTAMTTGADKATTSVKNNTEGVKRLSDEQRKLNEETLKWAENLAKSTTDGKSQLDQQITDLQLQKDQSQLINSEDAIAQHEASITFLEQKAQAEEQYFIDQKRRLDEARGTTLKDDTQYFQAATALETQKNNASAKSEIELTKIKKQEQKRRADDTKSSLSFISSLQQESSKELFFIGKAAALAVAYIDGQAAVMKALSAAPPPFNFVLAALVGVAAAAGLARIASAQPPSFEQGGIVPGSSFTGDRVSANVNSGEMILNRPQQAKLFDIANGGGSGAKLDQAISLLSSILEQPITVNVSGKQLFSVIRGEIDGGRSFA